MSRRRPGAPGASDGGKQFLTLLFAIGVLVSPYLTRQLGAAGADGKWQPGEIVAVAGLCGVVVAGVLYVLAPFLKERIRDIRLNDADAWSEDVHFATEHDAERAVRVTLAAFEQHPEAVRLAFGRIFPGENARREEAYGTSLEHSKQLATITASAERQARAVETLERTTDKLINATENLTRAVDKIGSQTEEHGRSLAAMGATVAAWDGTNRRHGERRGIDHRTEGAGG